MLPIQTGKLQEEIAVQNGCSENATLIRNQWLQLC